MTWLRWLDLAANVLAVYGLVYFSLWCGRKANEEDE